MTAPGSCPCGNGAPYPDCCGRFHRKAARPASAEQLMRSRFKKHRGAWHYLDGTFLSD